MNFGKGPTWSWRSSAAAQKIATGIWSPSVGNMLEPAFPNIGSSILEKVESPSCGWRANAMRPMEFIQKGRQLLPFFYRVSQLTLRKSFLINLLRTVLAGRRGSHE